MKEEFLWSQKYRPKTVNECVLPEELKKAFQQFVDNKNIPTLLLTGRSGVGKTTVARAMLEEINADYILINGSLDGNIDTLRTRIQQFASTVSFRGGRKYVILDESDYLTPATQPALRGFLDEFSKNCGFIFTCNYKDRIIEPLRSRCSVIEFVTPKEERAKLASAFFTRVCNILDENKITYEPSVVAAILTKYFPDWRRVLNELQRYSHNGSIDSGILSVVNEESFTKLIDFLKTKNFTEVRKWVAENSTDTSTIYRKFYDEASNLITPQSIPHLVLILADYGFKDGQVNDKEINLAACMVEIMVQVTFL